MGIINASLTRYIVHHPETAPVPHIEVSPMPVADHSTKIAELDRLIESLQSELDATPNRLWTNPGTQYRLSALIRLTAKRHLLSL